jgi:filamentous hemagglutinin family protein
MMHTGIDMKAPVTINGSLVATAADVEKVRFPGPRGETGPQGIPGSSFDPSQTYESVQAKQMRVNRSTEDKWPTGWGQGVHAWDVYANGTVGAGKDGNVAAYMNRDGHIVANSSFRTPGFYSNSAGNDFKGGSSVHNPNNYGTHFPWHGDNKNYVRGDTEMRGNVNNIGNLGVGGTIVTNHVTGDPTRQSGRLHVSGGERLYLLNKDGVIVGKEWGGNGNLSVQGQLCIKDTCINEDDLKKLKGAIGGDGTVPNLVASSVKFPSANNTWTIQPESGIAFVIRDNSSSGDKRHAFFKDRYRDA